MKNISDLPGSDPAPFLQLPRDISDVESMPTAVANGWSKSFVKEVSGILIQRQACKIEDPGPDDSVIPVMAVFRAKLDKDGLLDKLKTRVVFRGGSLRTQGPTRSMESTCEFPDPQAFPCLRRQEWYLSNASGLSTCIPTSQNA